MEVRYPPPKKGYLSDTGAIPYEKKANGCDTRLCDTISQRYCAIGEASRTGPLSSHLEASCLRLEARRYHFFEELWRYLLQRKTLYIDRFLGKDLLGLEVGSRLSEEVALRIARPATAVSWARSVPGSAPKSAPNKTGLSEGVSRRPFGPALGSGVPKKVSLKHPVFGDTPRNTSGSWSGGQQK